MDFEGALNICESSFPHPENSVLSTELGSSRTLARISLIVKGFAQLASGNCDVLLEYRPFEMRWINKWL
jgi:hypothetical protein